MLRCTAPMIPMGLFAIALLVRAVAGLAFVGPAYPDSYYYVNVAREIVAGKRKVLKPDVRIACALQGFREAVGIRRKCS